MLSAHLLEEGYEVAAASHASEGLIFLREKQVDLLVTDVRMPGDIDGVELVEIYRKERPHMRVLFITAYPPSGKLKKELTSKWTDLLRKPFSLDELSGAVRELLDK